MKSILTIYRWLRVRWLHERIEAMGRSCWLSPHGECATCRRIRRAQIKVERIELEMRLPRMEVV